MIRTITSLLVIAALAHAEDDPRDFEVTLDGKGAVSVAGRSVDDGQFSEALEAAKAEFGTREGSATDLRICIACKETTPFSGFKRVLDLASKLRAWDFRISIGDEFVVLALPKDRGVLVSRDEPPKPVRAHLCSTGDSADHEKDWAAHVAKARTGEASRRAWIWIEGDGGKPEEADSKTISRVIARMSELRGKEGPRFEFAVDPDVAMPHVLAVLAELDGGGRYSLAAEEKAAREGEPWMVSFPEPCTFLAPEQKKEK